MKTRKLTIEISERTIGNLLFYSATFALMGLFFIFALTVYSNSTLLLGALTGGLIATALLVGSSLMESN